jgi:hypothetical protein
MVHDHHLAAPAPATRLMASTRPDQNQCPPTRQRRPTNGSPIPHPDRIEQQAGRRLQLDRHGPYGLFVPNADSMYQDWSASVIGLHRCDRQWCRVPHRIDLSAASLLPIGLVIRRLIRPVHRFIVRLPSRSGRGAVYRCPRTGFCGLVGTGWWCTLSVGLAWSGSARRPAGRVTRGLPCLQNLK